MQLDNQQVEALFEFVEKKGARYYDLQCELVDHLTESIETEMTNDYLLSFESALQLVYKRFGIFGFAKIVQQKQEAIEKKFSHLLWQEIRSCFKIPRIVLTALFLLLVIMLSQKISGEDRLNILYASFIVLTAIQITQGIIYHKQVIKKLISLNCLFIIYSTNTFWLVQAFIINDTKQISTPVFVSAMLLSFILFFSNYLVKRNIYSIAKNHYPEAFKHA